MAERRRNLRGGRFKSFKPNIFEPISGGRYRKSRHQLALIVQDSGSHTAHPEFKFFIVASRSLLADASKFPLKCRQLGDAVASVPGQTGAGCIGPNALSIVMGQKQFSDRCQVQRRAPTDSANHLHSRPLAVGSLDIDDLVPLAHRQVHGLVGYLVEFAHRAKCCVANIEPRLDEVSQFQQTHAQSIASGLRAIYKTPYRQIIENSMRSRRMQTGLCADLLQ